MHIPISSSLDSGFTPLTFNGILHTEDLRSLLWTPSLTATDGSIINIVLYEDRLYI